MKKTALGALVLAAVAAALWMRPAPEPPADAEAFATFYGGNHVAGPAAGLGAEMRAFFREDPDLFRVRSLGDARAFNPELSDFLNCKYLVTSGGNDLLEGRAGYRKMAFSPAFRIYLSETVLPRAFVVHESRVSRRPEDVGALVRSRPAALRKTVFFDRASGEGPSVAVRRSGKPDRTSVRVYEPGRVEIDVEAAATGYLVLTDRYEPGWSATVDGRRVPVLPADRWYRAVRLPEGRHRVTFAYAPALFVVQPSAGVLNFSRHE